MSFYKVKITPQNNAAGESTFVARDVNGKLSGKLDDEHLKVYFQLPNGKKTPATIINRSSQELVVRLPEGVILGVSRIFVHRYDDVRATSSNSNIQGRTRVAESPLVSNPAQFDPTSSYVFVALPEAVFKAKGIEGQLAVLDGANPESPTDQQLVARIPLGVYSTKGYVPTGTAEDNPLPRDVAVTPDNTRAYVTMRGSER